LAAVAERRQSAGLRRNDEDPGIADLRRRPLAMSGLGSIDRYIAQTGSAMTGTESNRRPIAARGSAWARRFAAALARSAVTPNQISVASIMFAAIGAVLLIYQPTASGLILCAMCIQLRLICNLLDGMVAMEGGKASAVGKIYNEFPDRIADSLLIVAAGYACGYPWLGWLGALLAALTAYVRVFGGSLGFAQDFRGPLAKQQRMAVLTVACVLGAAETFWHSERDALLIAATLTAVGSFVTCITRTGAIAAQLRAGESR
jgi:phosphatidylglycerophosphate synthase